MTRLDVSPRSIMAATTVLIARTISISAGAGARIVDSASDEHRTQMAWVSAEQGTVDADKACGCLPQPPNFDLPPPPMPPPSFGDFGSLSEGIDWATALTSDPVLETCQKDVDRWYNNFGDGIFSPKWTGGEGDDGNEKGVGDDSADFNPETPRFFGFLDQPLAVLVIIAAAVCILFLSLCLLACFCRRKSNRRACLNCCLGSNKKTAAYRNGSSVNGPRRSKGNGKFLAVVEAASPATTTTIIAPKLGYRPGYTLSNGCDSAEEMSDGEHDHFMGKSDYGRSASATDWSYNPMRSTIGISAKPNGVHTRINSSTLNGGTKYGAIPTEPPPFDRATMHQPLPTMVTRLENGKILTRASPPVLPGASQLDHSSLLYDNHNPIYEEISLHDKSSENCTPQRRAPRRLSEGMGNYVDSGASSANSDAHFQFADGEEDEGDQDQENTDNGHPPRYYVVEGTDDQHAVNSPCCSSGRSECDECCAQDSSGSHNRVSCPFSPRPRQRQRPQDFMPAPSGTPSPIRNKLLTNKVNRSTQSGESCLGNDEFYSNCCECSGRESGYGTEGRRHPTPQRRGGNRYGGGGSKTSTRKTQTMDTAGNRDVGERAKSQNQVVPSTNFYTMRNDRHLDNVNGSPVIMTRKGAHGGKAGSPRYVGNGNGLQLQAMSSDDVHLHKSAFV